jgi:hypothetical protein
MNKGWGVEMSNHQNGYLRSRDTTVLSVEDIDAENSIIDRRLIEEEAQPLLRENPELREDVEMERLQGMPWFKRPSVCNLRL